MCGVDKAVGFHKKQKVVLYTLYTKIFTKSNIFNLAEPTK